MLEFTRNLEESLISIQNELIWRTYRVGQYREFFVYEPKKRLIMALPFRDRVVQWAIYRVLNPVFDRRYIADSFACRAGYGTHRAVDRLQHWLRYLDRRPGRIYVLKLDISKYFYRVDHDTLLKILGRIIKDRDLMWLLESIIRAENTKFGLVLGDHSFQRERVAECGMPIGNLSSQMFANLYLNELDQHAKHVLKARHYIRYMDDVIILHPDKRRLWRLKEEISAFLQDQLRLTLNNKTTVRSADQGVDFCGYRTWPTHRRLRKTTAKKMRRRLRFLSRAYARGEVGLETSNASVQSYVGLLMHCNSYRLRESVFGGLVLRRQ
ncbi:MAG: reverse transcriptase/maturase family protein [Bacillota bacterium]